MEMASTLAYEKKQVMSKANKIRSLMERANQWGPDWISARAGTMLPEPGAMEIAYRANRMDRYNLCQELLRLLGHADSLMTQCMQRGETPTKYTSIPTQWHALMGKDMYAAYTKARSALETLEQTSSGVTGSRILPTGPSQTSAIAAKRMAAREAARRYREKKRAEVALAQRKLMQHMEAQGGVTLVKNLRDVQPTDWPAVMQPLDINDDAAMDAFNEAQLKALTPPGDKPQFNWSDVIGGGGEEKEQG